MVVLHMLAALGLLAAAAYAQHRIGAHTAHPRNALLTRGVLALVGIALGYVFASYAPGGPLAVLAFAEGIGLAHFPAAMILFMKRARGEARS